MQLFLAGQDAVVEVVVSDSHRG
ncbi:MAG: hypothetical protein JWR74_799, partial [Polaromonas sp.]|nr:hypothetical protein [Polaromonas sp.]